MDGRDQGTICEGVKEKNPGIFFPIKNVKIKFNYQLIYSDFVALCGKKF